jgi:hypothetical protein
MAGKAHPHWTRKHVSGVTVQFTLYEGNPKADYGYSKELAARLLALRSKGAARSRARRTGRGACAS